MPNMVSTFDISNYINTMRIANTKSNTLKFIVPQPYNDLAMKIDVTWGNTYCKLCYSLHEVCKSLQYVSLH